MAPCDSVVDLPIGFKFHPRDDELLGYYLLKKVHGTPFMYDKVVPEVDLYGRIEMWDIWNEYGGQKLEKDEDLYFFTKLKKANNGKGSRVARTIGHGTWKGEDSGTDVKDPKKRKLGLLKRFSYLNPKDHNGGWIMHEYSLHPSLDKRDDGQYVLCRIRKNDNKKRQVAHDHDDTTAQSRNKIQKQLENNDELLSANYSPTSEVNYHYHQQLQQTATTSTTDLNATDMPIDQPQYFVTKYPTEQQMEQTVNTSTCMNVTNWTTGLTDQPQYFFGTENLSSNGDYISQSQQEYSVADPTMSSSLARQEHLQINDFSQFNEERTTSTYIGEYNTAQEGLTNNNNFGIESAQLSVLDYQLDNDNVFDFQPYNDDVFDFQIDDEILKLIQFDAPQSFATESCIGTENTTTATTEATGNNEVYFPPLSPQWS